MTADDYWEMRRDIRKDDQILFDERHTPPAENPDNWRRSNYDPRIHGTRITPRDEFLVIGAVRHAQGSSDYVVRRTTRFVIDHWDDLSENTRFILTRDAGVDLHMRQEETPDQAAHYRLTNPDWEAYLDHLERNQK